MAKRKINSRQLKAILDLHEKFLHDKNDGKRADLSELDLSCANLSGANLYYASLTGADLSCAHLSDADLSGADLSGANLSRANLSCAHLNGANLSRANLPFADLFMADLSHADLSHADLSCAHLFRADLRYANLSHAELNGTNFIEAYLSGATGLDTASANELTAGFHMVPPETGAYTAWKKASRCLVKLLIPEGALRSSATTRKCRASKATVLGIYTLKGNKSTRSSVCSGYDPDFIYRVGKTVKVLDFDTDRWNECSTGIHHFLTMAEAVRYRQ